MIPTVKKLVRGKEGHLFLPVVYIDDLAGFIQIDGSFFRTDMVNEILVLADIADKSVVPEILKWIPLRPKRRISSCWADRHT